MFSLYTRRERNGQQSVCARSIFARTNFKKKTLKIKSYDFVGMKEKIVEHECKHVRGVVIVVKKFYNVNSRLNLGIFCSISVLKLSGLGNASDEESFFMHS